MPILQRIIHQENKISDNWTEYVIRLDNEDIEISSKDLNQLKLIEKENEYNYTISYDNMINLDHSPRLIEEKIQSEDFINNYKKYINSKFFISYYIKEK